MNFLVNNKIFSTELDFSDRIIIKSSNKNYNVFYRNNNLNELITEIYKENDFLFIDRNVYNLSTHTFDKINNIYIFDAIEHNKTMESVLHLTDMLYTQIFTKKNKLIVVGGGITQDVGGFAAAIYKRGINWTYIPTTILAMTDSCIGSKVSINRNSKNMLGVYVAPNNIYISDYFLQSLKSDDIISGIGESLKLSLIGGIETYNYFKENLKQQNYINIIKISSLVKKQIIEFDEFEIEERKVLNYGHTIGHALESTTDFYIPHGIGVLIGIYIKNVLFYEDKHNEINNLILQLVDSKFFQVKIDYDNFIKHVLSDKKNNGDNICFILLDEIGKSIMVYKKLSEIIDNLRRVMAKIFSNIY